jgi:hypothetical protein
MAQGDIPNSKGDTRFSSVDGGAGLADLALDLSQLADDIVVGVSSVYEGAAQARWDVGAPAAWELDIDATDTDAGYLFTYEAGGSGVRLQLAAAGVIDAYVDGVSIAQVTVASIDAGGDRVIISWSMESNPYTTGAGDAVRSELRALNLDDGTHYQVTSTHAGPSSVAATAVWLASTSAGANAFTGTANALRFSAERFHPTAEAREDFDALTPAPTLVLEERVESPVPSRVSAAGDDDQFTGPVYMAAAAGIVPTDVLQAGRDWAVRYRFAVDHSEVPSAPRSLAVPGDGAFTFLGQYAVLRVMPRPVNRLVVRVQVQSWRTDAMPPDNVVLRAYLMNRPPTGLVDVQGPQPQWVRFWAELTVLVEDGDGPTGGAWYEFEPIGIARDDGNDAVWCVLAYDITDDGGGGTNRQMFRVWDWTGEAGVEIVVGGLPLAGGLG